MNYSISSELSLNNEFIEISLCRNSRKVFEESSDWLRRVLRTRKASNLLKKHQGFERIAEQAGYALDKLGFVPSEVLHVHPQEAAAFIQAVALLAPKKKSLRKYLLLSFYSQLRFRW